MTQEPTNETRPRLTPVTYTLSLALTAYGLGLFGLGPCLTSIAATYGAALGALGALFTAFFAGFVAGVLGAGYVAQSVGKRPVVAAGLVILSAGFLSLAWSPGPPALPRLWWALGAMAVMGIGGGTVEATACALAADVNPRREGFALNLMQAFFGFGAIAGPLMVSLALARGWPWQTHFFISGALAALVLVVLLFQPVREQVAPVPALRETARLLRRPGLLALCGAMALYVGAEIGYSQWISPLVERSLGAPAALAGTAVTAFWVAMTVGRLACTWLVEIISPRALMIALAGVAAACAAATGAAPSAPWGIAMAGVTGLFYSGMFGLILTTASHQFAASRTLVFSLVMASVGIGGMTLPAAMGVVVEQAPLRWAMAEAAALRWAMLAPAAAMAAVAAVTAAALRRDAAHA